MPGRTEETTEQSKLCMEKENLLEFCHVEQNMHKKEQEKRCRKSFEWKQNRTFTRKCNNCLRLEVYYEIMWQVVMENLTDSFVAQPDFGRKIRITLVIPPPTSSWGRKIMICVAFFSKFCQISSEVLIRFNYLTILYSYLTTLVTSNRE